MAAKKEKVLMHYFKVAVGQDPATASGVADAKQDLLDTKGVESVEYIRSALKSISE